MLVKARDSDRDTLVDLRAVVHGIHPPVLSDRGLVGAVDTLALALPMPITVTATLASRPPAPVESAVYFAVAESLANVAKHATAGHASVTLTDGDGVLGFAVIEDDGVGGAHLQPDGGLAGVARRLAVFDGTVEVSSPPGGPTRITLAVPSAS